MISQNLLGKTRKYIDISRLILDYKSKLRVNRKSGKESQKMKQKKYEDLKHSGRTKRKRQMEDAFKEVTHTLYNEIT